MQRNLHGKSSPRIFAQMSDDSDRVCSSERDGNGGRRPQLIVVTSVGDSSSCTEQADLRVAK